ncbi:MAG TPA: twitching motility protein PilT [Gammaproteobacteria bacterium]|nr:twitching motility protein PilT [Gammaproteobacteria bacterium]
MTLVLDSGALIALEKNDRAMWRRLKAELLAGRVPMSHGGVVGQVWRGGGARQALLAMALDGMEVRALGESLGRAAGDLLARAGAADVIDAALVLLADDGDDIATSDAHDLEPLAALAGRHVELLEV